MRGLLMEMNCSEIDN